MSVNISIDTSQVDALMDKLESGAAGLKRAILENASETIGEKMREVIPVDTGAARDSITIDDYGDSFAIGPHTGYTLGLDQGTQPHEIYAVNAKALMITLADGSVIFRKHVHHPGTEPTHFIDETLAESVDDINDTIEAAMAAFFGDLSS